MRSVTANPPNTFTEASDYGDDRRDRREVEPLVDSDDADRSRTRPPARYREWRWSTDMSGVCSAGVTDQTT